MKWLIYALLVGSAALEAESAWARGGCRAGGGGGQRRGGETAGRFVIPLGESPSMRQMQLAEARRQWQATLQRQQEAARQQQAEAAEAKAQAEQRKLQLRKERLAEKQAKLRATRERNLARRSSTERVVERD